MLINNGNRTEWSPIREPDFLIMSMITDIIERHEVLLLINQNYDKIRERK